jgi:F-type H+-transporting ATPase subunit b
LDTIFKLAIIVFALLVASEAFAEEGTSPGRKLWNNVMLFVNFGIMAFFFLKYAKKPLMDALHGVRDKIEKNLKGLESQLQEAKSARDEEADKIEQIDHRIAEVRESILEMGQREKQKIIEQGEASAKRLVSDAQQYAEYKMSQARKALSDEMVDTAISIVEERMKKVISGEDNDRLVNQFVDDLAGRSKIT